MFLVVQINNLQHCHGIIYTSVKIPIKKCAQCKWFSVTNFSSCTSVQCSVEDRNLRNSQQLYMETSVDGSKLKNLMQNLTQHRLHGWWHFEKICYRLSHIWTKPTSRTKLGSSRTIWTISHPCSCVLNLHKACSISKT